MSFSLSPKSFNNKDFSQDEKLTIVRESTSKAVVEVYNTNGAVMQSFEMNELSRDIDVSNLSSGVYLIRVIGNQATHIQRFIKN